MGTVGGAQSLREFRAELLRDIYRGHYQIVDDNYDHFRFGFDGVDRSKQVNVDGHAAYLDFVLSHLESFFAASLLFSDATSRALFTRLIKYRCLGHPHLRIWEDMTWTSVQEMYQRAAAYETGPSSSSIQGVFGPLMHFNGIPSAEGPISLDVWRGSVAYGLGQGNHRHYFFERDGIRIAPSPGDCIIDGGACFGDTGVFFACAAGPEGRVYSFEPLPTHIDVISLNIDQNKLEDRMFIVPNGLGERTNQVQAIAPEFAQMSTPGFSLTNIENAVPVISLDDFSTLQNLERVDFLKLDVEGFELATLKGAARTIEASRPRLAISLYHKPEDFFEIPIYLKMNYPFYRLYLDHYTIFQEETVLFAIPE
jgi:FkbM family methyltransferase